MDAATNRVLAAGCQEAGAAAYPQQQQPSSTGDLDWQGRQMSMSRQDLPLSKHPLGESEDFGQVASAKRRRTNEQGEAVSDGDGLDEGEDEDDDGGEGEDEGEEEGDGGGPEGCDGEGGGLPELDALKKDPQDTWQMMLMQQQQMQMQQVQQVMDAAAAANAAAGMGQSGSGQGGMDAAVQEQQRQQMEALVSASSQLPLLPLVLSGNTADQQQQQQQDDGGMHMMNPAAAAAAEAAVAEATAAASQAAAAAATHDAMSLSMGMHWLAAQQQVAAAELDARRRDPNGQRGLRKPDGTLSDPGLSAAVDAATAAAMAGGADADTAAAMSASIAALMADPAAAAAAAAAMSDPNNPANMQALAQLAQLQSLGQLPPGTSADVLNSSFSALVAAAVGMAALEGGHGGGAGGMPQGLMGLPETAVLTGLNMMQGSQAGMEMSMQAAMDMQNAQNAAAGQANKARGRPRKSGAAETSSAAASHAPTGNWMRRFHELAYLADKASLDAAKISNATMTVQVQWVNMPEELQSKLSNSPAPIELPSNATVSFLKRAIGRTLGGHLAPTLLRNHTNRELISDDPDDQQLAALGITHNSYILMECDFHPIQNFGTMPATSTQRLAGVSTPGMGFSTPGAGSSCRVGSKERFTLTEMYSLVEGMEQHGLKWAKIHKDFKDLENKTQGDLKDKWRNWQRNVANGWTTARVYMPDELKQRIEKMVHDYNQQTANAEGRLMQAPSQTDAAVAAAMAAHGIHLHGLDPSQLVGMDPATAAALAAHHQAQAHAMHQHHYDAAMVAALAGVAVDPATAAANQQQQQQMAAAVSSAAAAAAAAGGDMMSEQSMQQQHRHHQHQDQGSYQGYDPSQGM